jgi:hypothetical protein
MPVPPSWEPEGGEPARALPAVPFWFTVTRPVFLAAPDTYETIGSLGTEGEYKAVEVAGAWELVEDHFGRRGWVPGSVIPKRVRRQKGAGAGKGP